MQPVLGLSPCGAEEVLLSAADSGVLQKLEPLAQLLSLPEASQCLGLLLQNGPLQKPLSPQTFKARSFIYEKRRMLICMGQVLVNQACEKGVTRPALKLLNCSMILTKILIFS